MGSLSTVLGDEKLTSREDPIGPLRLKTKSSEVILLGTFLASKEYNKRKGI